ncbi:acylglycerol kinase, mitochondrial [Trichogramma pretiosum]|uniref:acylglycerol kinase, mitochondrial n=1 Tax=Trichogramma pretiosum TaxID=7493 RepID=UPI0006C9BE52|nr:acylglycerol kinase, mitochondrial [Trichogramma pretiosum]
MEVLRTLRRNWKKSTFGFAALVYGTNYAVKSYEISELMKKSCLEAASVGNQLLREDQNPQKITVIVNPAASNRKAVKLFEKYCEPLLHLAGFTVTIRQTQSEVHARNIYGSLNKDQDALVVAGGDGTLADVITAFMRENRHTNAEEGCPIGIVPLGKLNRFAESFLFRGAEQLRDKAKIIEATMLIIRGKTKLVDVIEIDLVNKNSEQPEQSVYALGTIEMGIWKDVFSRADKYWYFGALRRYATYLFSSYKSDIKWQHDGIIRYSDPCKGCSKCYKEDQIQQQTTNKRWYHRLYSVSDNKPNVNAVDLSRVENDKCGIMREHPYETTELRISTQNVYEATDIKKPSLIVELGRQSLSYSEYLAEGWRRLRNGPPEWHEVLLVRNIELTPSGADDENQAKSDIYIDGEKFELKPLKMKLLKEKVKVFSQ